MDTRAATRATTTASGSSIPRRGRSRSGWRTARSSASRSFLAARATPPRTSTTPECSPGRSTRGCSARRTTESPSSASPPRASVRRGPGRTRSPRSRRARTTPRSSGSGRRTLAGVSVDGRRRDRPANRGLTEVPSASAWSFPPRPDTHHVRWIEPCPADRPGAVVRRDRGRGAGRDAGRRGTWVDRPEGSRRDTTRSRPTRTRPTGCTRPRATGSRRATTGATRGGSSTAGSVTGTSGGAVDPGDPETALVSAASGARAAHSRGEASLPTICGWTGGTSGTMVGETAMRTGAPRPTRAPLRAARRPGIPTGEGTYRAVLASGRADGTMWAVHNEGLYRTRDAGESFERVPADLPASPARALAIE